MVSARPKTAGRAYTETIKLAVSAGERRSDIAADKRMVRTVIGMMIVGIEAIRAGSRLGAVPGVAVIFASAFQIHSMSSTQGSLPCHRTKRYVPGLLPA